MEETGYRADSLKAVFKGPISAGLSTEILTIVKAEKLQKVHEGGGVDGEDIQVHRVPVSEVKQWLLNTPVMVDPKVFAAFVLSGEL